MLSNHRVLTAAALCALTLSVNQPTTADPAPPIVITINAARDRKPISPGIYGTAWASQTALKDLHASLNRFGGNSVTRYNWAQNADNRGADWYFESLPDKSAAPGERGDTFIDDTLKSGASPLITVPMIGWIGKLGPGRSKLTSFSVKKYGPQQKTDPYDPDAGNGIKPDGTNVTGNDPADASVKSDVSDQRAWIRHIVTTWGLSTPQKRRYYLLDNEPSIWHGTHRDVHPIGATMDEIAQKSLEYSAMIKSLDPQALVVGPEEWGWNGYLYSGYDQQYSSLHHWDGVNPDRAKHGGEDYLPWLLDQFNADRKRTGKLPVDVFSVHYYPQGGEFGDDASAAVQLKRNRSTRSLWDPSYKDESWINANVMLIPRIKEWARQHCPGMKTAITEYSWGAEGSIGGATAQADILGILGREGVDIATRWGTPDAATPTYKAMKLYSNYDGAGSGFGNISVSDIVPNPDELSSFAAIRAKDGALTVMVINKSLTASHDIAIHLGDFAAGSQASAWQLTATNRIDNLPAARVEKDEFPETVPAQSISLFVIPPGK